MEQIAAGKGKAPKPFMLAKAGRGKADAVWNSNRGDAAEARAGEQDSGAARTGQDARAGKAGQGARKPRCRISSRRSSARWSIARPQRMAGATRSSSTATACRLRVEDGEATLKTRKGLDWTDKFRAIAKAGSALPDALIDGEIVALDRQRRAGFLRAAGGAVRRQDRRSDLLRVRSAVRRRRGSARACRSASARNG